MTWFAYASIAATPSALTERTFWAFGAPAAVEVLIAPKAPNSTLVTERFIALPISTVSSVPEAPTSAPATIRTLLPSTKPVDAAARPVNELSSEMTTGMSAPPIGSTNRIPSTNEATSAIQKNASAFGTLATTSPQQTRIASATSALTICWPGYVIGRPVMTSCSLRKAMIEPANEIAPITAESTEVNDTS